MDDAVQDGIIFSILRRVSSNSSSSLPQSDIDRLYQFLWQAKPSSTGLLTELSSDLQLIEADVHNEPEMVWAVDGSTVLHLAVTWNFPNKYSANRNSATFYDDLYDTNASNPLHNLFNLLSKVKEEDQLSEGQLQVEYELCQDPDAVWTKDGFTALHLAVYWILPDAIAYLVQCGLAPTLINAREYHGRTPLHLAVNNGSVECIRALRRVPEIDLYAEDDKGVTPVELLFKDKNQKKFHYQTIACFMDILNAEQLLIPDRTGPAHLCVFTGILLTGSEDVRRLLFSRLGQYGRISSKETCFIIYGRSNIPDEFDYCRQVADTMRKGLQDSTDDFLDALSCLDIRSLRWDSFFRDSLVPMLLQTAVREARPQLVQGLLHLADRDRIHIILTFRSYSSQHPVLHRTCLEWAVANNDRLTTNLILNEEYQYHKADRTAGLHCIRSQMNQDELVVWTIETFSLYYGKTWAQKKVLPIFKTGFLLISVFGFLYDYYSDSVLALDYYDKGFNDGLNQDNQTMDVDSRGVICAANGTFNDTVNCNDTPFASRDYKIALFTTLLSIAIPLIFPYIIFFNEFCAKPIREGGMIQGCLALFTSFLLFPASIIIVAAKHMYYKFWHARARRKTRFRDKLERYEFIWGLLRMAEAGVEASGQLLLQIWLLSFSLGSLANLSLTEVLKKTGKGVLLFMFETCPLERSMGKLFISTIGILHGMVSAYRNVKRGSVDFHHATFFLLSLIFQVGARIIAIGVHFAAARTHPYKAHVIIIGVILHYIIVFLIKWRVENAWAAKGLYSRTSAVISVLASSLGFVRITPANPPANYARKNIWKSGSQATFYAQLLFFILALVENILLVCSPYMLQVDKGENSNLALRCFGPVSINRCIGLIFFLMVASWVCQLIYYKVFGHPWVDINGSDWLQDWTGGSGKKKTLKALEEEIVAQKVLTNQSLNIMPMRDFPASLNKSPRGKGKSIM